MMSTPSAHIRQRPASGVGRARDADRDGLILEAVLNLISEQGHASLAMETVAARAGVGKSTVYRRWGNMADLLADALDTLAFPMDPVTPSGELRRDLIQGLINASGCLDVRRQQIISAILTSAHNDPATLGRLRQRFYASVESALRVAFCDDQDDATAHVSDQPGLTHDATEMRLALVVGFLISFPQVAKRPLEREDFARFVDHVLLPLFDRPTAR